MQGNITEGQLREVLQHIQGPQDVLVGNSKVTPKGKSIKTTNTFKASSVTNTLNVKDKERTTMIFGVRVHLK